MKNPSPMPSPEIILFRFGFDLNYMKQRNHVFYLKSPNSADETSIQYRCHISGALFKYGTRQSIIPEFWDEETDRPITDKETIKEFKSEFPNLKTRLNNIKSILDNICIEVDSFLSNAEINRIEIDFKALRTHLNNTVLKSSQTKNTGKGSIKTALAERTGTDFQFIRQYTEYFIKAITNGSQTIQQGNNYKKRYSLSTIKNYKGFLVKWIEFEKNQNKRFKWVDINQLFYDQFVHYFNSINYTDNTTGRLVKHLKVIMQAALTAGFHYNKSFRESYFKTLSSKSDNIALTFEEVEKLEKIDLSGNLGFDKARDIFLIGCYTALRFSDLKRLKKEYIKDNYIEIPTQKTKKKVVIPIKPNLARILKKYNYQAPKIAEQKVNEYIKKIGKDAGIDGLEHIVETRGGISTENQFNRFELITTHTARRTAATQMYILDPKPQPIMEITGHTTEISFFKYIIIPKGEKIKQLFDYAFFKK